MNNKDNKIASFASNVWGNEIEKLIEDFLDKDGVVDVSATVNKLLSSWFSHQDRELYIQEPNEAADTVYTVTNLVTFVVKLNECWQQYQNTKKTAQ